MTVDTRSNLKTVTIRHNAETELQRAADRLRELTTGGVTPVSSRNDAERRYAVAYQRLVRTGDRPQIRRKYRIGV